MNISKFLAMCVMLLFTVSVTGFRPANAEAWKPEPKFDVEGSRYIETLTFISGISYTLTEINNELKRQSKTSFICGAPDAIGTKLIIEILNQRYIGSITSEQAIEAIVLGLKERYPCK